MYEHVFNLTSRTFTTTPFVPHYFATEAMAQSLSHARMCIDRASGPVIITGASGTGKSLLLALLAEQYQASYRVVSLACARLSQRTDLLQNILFELRLPYRGMSEGELRLSLIDYLKSGDCSDKGMLLLIDEAHSLSTDLLDELRLITNFVRNGKHHVALVMAGSAALEDHLIETKSESFNQRIAARCHLVNLSQAETIEYVLTHVERAGGNGEELFTGEALKVIHRASDGCPRVINQLCDYSLVLAASLNTPRITAEIARRAWQDVQSIPGSMPPVESANSRGIGTTNLMATSADGSMVIEFGPLDDEPRPSQATVENAVMEPEFNEWPADDCQPLPTSDPRGDGGQPQSLSQPQRSDSIDGLPQRSPQLRSDTGRESTGNVPEPDGNHNDGGYANPFEESFDHEETIHATFYPIVSEQNLMSLMLTPAQLSILDCLESQYAGPPVGHHEYVATDCGEESCLELDTGLPDDENAAGELALSPQELAELVRIEEDIRLLQRQYSFSGQTDAGQTTFKTTADNQPWEELMQSHSVAQPAGTGNSIPLLPSRNQTALNVSRNRGSVSDDRDIMIINDSGEVRRPKTRVDKANDSSAVVSTGTAARMDYQDLFRQLRQAQ